ncbi:hypothetical protein [Geothermobacter hydrogeniphilus]|uniref:hypothetical protein n=1 Tax=Geothermobacter hydrogeniphilus TaxID=1969733 RepID=UPI0013049417|nr:hypothetical protein [Geothermobacter hydrogeniphilus]
MKYSFRFFSIICITFSVVSCAQPQYQTLLSTDSMIRFRHAKTDEALTAINNAAINHCFKSQAKAQKGKTICDGEECETSYICE